MRASGHVLEVKIRILPVHEPMSGFCASAGKSDQLRAQVADDEPILGMTMAQ